MQVPHIFSPGLAARSHEVNENFAALAEAVTAMQAQVEALQGGSVPLPGNYFLMGFQTGLIPAGAGAVIEGIVYTGQVTLSAGGGLTMTLREAKNEMHITQPATTRVFKDVTETLEGSWTSSPPNVALSLMLPGNPQPLRFARGGPRLLIGNHLNASDGSSVMLFLVRTGP